MVKPIDQLEGWAPKREAMKLAVGWRVRVTPPAITRFDPSEIDLTDDQYERFLKWHYLGGLIQDALPELSTDEREILQSGISPEQWKEAFGNDE